MPRKAIIFSGCQLQKRTSRQTNAYYSIKLQILFTCNLEHISDNS